MLLLETMAFGLLGGVARACVGLIKAMRSGVQIVWSYTLTTIIASGIIGAAAGTLFGSEPKIAVVSGYVGMDLLENAYKIIIKKQPKKR